VLAAASDLDALLVAHRVLCFESGTLALMSGQATDDNIIDFHGGRRRASGSERG
jgi:hypothetical protein